MSRPLALLLTALSAYLGQLAIADERPNVIIIYTDDHGYADLSCQGSLDDVKTPHTDQLAVDGVRFTDGYCSAPQCRPSRAGLLTGRYQNRFGLEENNDNALPWSEYTIAERLRDAGYVTGMCGKWHLEGAVGSNGELPDGTTATPEQIANGKPGGLGADNPGHAGGHGFMEYFCGSMRTYIATHDAAGKDLNGPVVHTDLRYRLEIQAEWAASFIHRNADRPFFLYVPFFAPHVPLEAPEKYLERFPGEMPRRRRMALAMISAVDDGVGLITKTLSDEGIDDNTLIFYISDNGAPLKIHKIDAPGAGAGWDGSLNDPWIGEKGMLTEGGIRVPFVARWPKHFPKGVEYSRPVIAFDAIATSLSAAGLELDDRLDGVDLLPLLTGQEQGDPHEALFWRWSGQAAVRRGDWKLLIGDDRKYLFDLSSKEQEHANLIGDHPDIAASLREKLEMWSRELVDPGLDAPMNTAGARYFDFYLDGVDIPAPEADSTQPSSRPQSSKRSQPLPPEELFRARDHNNDGQLTLDEFIGDPTNRNVPVLTKRFNAWDTNNDKQVTLEEMLGR